MRKITRRKLIKQKLITYSKILRFMRFYLRGTILHYALKSMLSLKAKICLQTKGEQRIRQTASKAKIKKSQANSK